MSNIIQKDDKSISAVKVGVVGAMAGAAVAAAALTFSDEKNRKMLQKKMKEVQVWGDKKTEDLRKKVDGLKSSTSQSIDDATEKGHELIEEVSDKGKKVLAKESESATQKTSSRHIN